MATRQLSIKTILQRLPVVARPLATQDFDYSGLTSLQDILILKCQLKTNKNTIMNGIVYFFKHIGIDGIKIGYTNSESCKSRFIHFSTYSPTGGIIVGTISTENPIELEKELHQKFIDRRLSGEFFDITEQEAKKVISTYSVSINEFFNNIEILKNLFTSDKISYSKKEKLNMLVKKAMATVSAETSNNEEKYSEIELKILETISPYENEKHSNRIDLSAQQIIDRYNFTDNNAVKIGLLLKKNGFIQNRVKADGAVKRLYKVYE